MTATETTWPHCAWPRQNATTTTTTTTLGYREVGPHRRMTTEELEALPNGSVIGVMAGGLRFSYFRDRRGHWRLRPSQTKRKWSAEQLAGCLVTTMAMGPA